MGVISCSRKDCETTMCRTHISTVGNICSDCQGEFEYYLAEKNIAVYSDYDIIFALKDFIDTPKSKFERQPDQVDIYEFFRKHTRD